MPRTVVYRAGGFTNCGIGYTKFSQEELAERRDRAMTENEAIARFKSCQENVGKCEKCRFYSCCGIYDMEDTTDEYETPTELTADREWKLKVIIPCHQKWRNRSATELLFCMLRSGK